MTDRERALRIEILVKGALYPYRLRPHSPRWNEVVRLLHEIGSSSPPPPPPPTTLGYAPRTHNWAGGVDARFCMDPKYGAVRDGAGYRDQMGVRYDDSGRDLGGRTGSETHIPELKGADSMDGLEPCDPYVGPTGVRIGGDAGYPAASFGR